MTYLVTTESVFFLTRESAYFQYIVFSTLICGG